MQEDIPFGSGYGSDLWQRIGTMLLAQSPFLLSYIAAIIVALVFIGKRTKPALLVTIAAGLLLVWTIAQTILHQLVMEQIYQGEIYPGEEPGWFLAIQIGWIVIHIASLALFVIAALGWRSESRSGIKSALAREGDARVGTGPSTPISKGAFITMIFGSSIVSWIMLIPAYAIIIAKNEDLIFVSLGFSCTAYMLGLLATITGCVLLYKLWATIQDEPVSTTPGKAVGFLFIPLFNFYWLFRAVYGWAKDVNRYTSERGIDAPRAPEGMVLTACILAVIPVVSLLASPVLLVIMWIYYGKAIDIANTIRAMRRAG